MVTITKKRSGINFFLIEMTMMTTIALRRNTKKNITPVNYPTYEEECGACHFPYQPELLPSGSWKKIMAGLGDHFEEEIEIDTESILGFLTITIFILDPIDFVSLLK